MGLRISLKLNIRQSLSDHGIEENGGDYAPENAGQ